MRAFRRSTFYAIVTDLLQQRRSVMGSDKFRRARPRASYDYSIPRTLEMRRRTAEAAVGIVKSMLSRLCAERHRGKEPWTVSNRERPHFRCGKVSRPIGQESAASNA
jgi:hypothetical protein